MRPRGLAALAALGGTVVIAGWGGAAHFASSRNEDAATTIVVRQATFALAGAEPVEAPQAAPDESGAAGAPAPIEAVIPVPTLPSPVLPPDQPVQLASVGAPDPVQGDAKAAAKPVEAREECPATPDICIDRYLWSIYQRTPKEDTITVSEPVKVTVKKNGKTHTITKIVAKLVDEDFGWKDPKAAQHAGMPLMDYVIGGMDRSFKVKLYHALRAMDDAGLEPGITSAFRDDYRQTLASGKKAATDRSYHGGSLRGGYGHGLAADLVSVKGETRAQRWTSSQELWKWIDAHERELGIGRPYLDRDPPHVGPCDGKEFVEKRARAKTRVARLDTNRRPAATASDEHGKGKDEHGKTTPAHTAASKPPQ
jgi:hypothetical protein